MERRKLLKTMVSATSAVGLIAAAGHSAAAKNASREVRVPTKAKSPAMSSDGTELFYRDWGAGRPLLFLAPWGLHSGWWEYQMAHLSTRGLRCIAYDRRGHGSSDESVAGYEFDALADDLAAVLKHLDLHDVTLVGQSMGCGEIVRYLARYNAHRIGRIVMIAPITPVIVKTSRNPEGLDPAYLEKVREVLSTDRPAAIAGGAAGFFGTPMNTVSPEMMGWWSEMLLQCPLKVLLELHRVFTVTDFTAELRRISLSTLIVHGDIDTSTPIDLTGRKTAQLVANSTLTVYEGAAHGLPITHMKRLNADLLAFVTEAA
jgi:non-heme chloroperoxidase